MADVARHIRIFDKEPTDDLVDKRSTTIASMAKQFLTLKSYNDYFQVAEDIAGALESDEFRSLDTRAIEVEEAICAHSPAFNREGQDLQILTCLMLAALKVIKDAQPNTKAGNAWNRPEIVAVCIWLCLGTQPPRAEPKVEALRVELLEASRMFILRAAEGSRARTAIPTPTVEIKGPSEVEIAEFNTGLLNSVVALRHNAALDREELDLLWWSLGDWSSLQQQHFRQLSMQVAAVTSGIEVSNLLRRLPSEGHKYLALRNVIDDSERTAAELVESLGDHAKPIRLIYSGKQTVKRFPHVFRLLAAILGEVVDTQSLGNRTWGGLAMLEATVLRQSESNGTVLE